MKYIKFLLPILIVFLTIGYAAQNITLSITGDAYIATDIEEFDVYISDLSLNGTQKLSMVNSSNSFTFKTGYRLDGDTVTYEVANNSAKFDALVTTECISDNLSGSHSISESTFETPTLINAKETKNGVVETSLEGQQELSESNITCTITATPVERNELGEGEVPEAADPWKIGNEITIDTETFNIISSTEDTVTLLAQHNLGTDYRQNESENSVTFTKSSGWAYSPGPKEIDIQAHAGNAKTYVNEYVIYLKSLTGDSNLTGNLITLTELKNLGCTINDNYAPDDEMTCANSKYSSWLVNGQYWWTRSASPRYLEEVWIMLDDGFMNNYFYHDAVGIRPIITISKEALSMSIIEFTIDGLPYHAYEGMTWGEWTESEFNVDSFTDSGNGIYTGDWYHYVIDDNYSTIYSEEEIISGYEYSLEVFCCFDAGSKVLMADGTLKNIEEVEIGDLVMSLNEETGEYITQRVSSTTINKKSTDLVYVYLSNGTRIGMRAYHPLLTTEGWKSLRPDSPDAKRENIEGLSLLEVGDTLVGYDENVTIVKVEQRPEVEDYYTYNIGVEGHHNYIVEGIVAHNMAGCII